MKTKKVWDEDGVYLLEDLLRNKDISETMLGRALAILCIKGKEFCDNLNLEGADRAPRQRCLHKDMDFSS